LIPQRSPAPRRAPLERSLHPPPPQAIGDLVAAVSENSAVVQDSEAPGPSSGGMQPWSSRSRMSPLDGRNSNYSCHAGGSTGSGGRSLTAPATARFHKWVHKNSVRHGPRAWTHRRTRRRSKQALKAGSGGTLLQRPAPGEATRAPDQAPRQEGVWVWRPLGLHKARSAGWPGPKIYV